MDVLIIFAIPIVYFIVKTVEYVVSSTPITLFPIAIGYLIGTIFLAIVTTKCGRATVAIAAVADF
jgi:hypothetical protein